MRFTKIFAATLTAAALLAGSQALAADSGHAALAQDGSVARPDSADSLTTDDQAGQALYGVRGGTAATLLGGTGSYDVIGKSAPTNTPTPGACASAGFPGGWCNTAAGIAASAFAWDGHAKGAGVVIGIVDTGIDLNHPDFAGRVLAGHCVTSSVNPCATANDQAGGDAAIFPGADATHGTHVSGIAAGSITGLATLASILPVKVCGSNTNACNGVDDGIVWASQHGANVINVSIGGPILSASDVTAFQTAIANGSLLVVAGGNSGTKDPSSGFLAGAALKDGVRGSMIVVGATGCQGPNPNVPANCANGGKGGIASFSQVPSTQCEVHAGQRVCLANYFVVAPGSDIWSTVGNGVATGANYGYLSGTSMATPYVTGVAAVIKGNWPQLTSSQVASIIFQTTDDLGAPGIDPVYGRGAVDITKALGPAGAAIVANHSFEAGPNQQANISSVITAVNGGQASAATLAQFGTSGALSSLVSGALSVAVQNSTILKTAVVIDSFGRTFTADLTRAVSVQPMVDLGRLMQSSNYVNYTGFGTAVDTPLGLVSASGFSVESTTPQLLSSEYVEKDRSRYALRDFSMSLGVMPGVSVQLGYNMDMAGRFNPYDATGSRAYDGMFFSASALNSPYVSLTDGGNFIGSTVNFSDTLRFQFGATSLAPQSAEFQVPDHPMVDQLMGPQPLLDPRRAEASMASLTWDFAKWGGLGLTLSQTDEHNSLLGGYSSGALSISRLAQTTAAGFSGRVGFGDGWVSTLSFSEGVTHLALNPNGLVDGADALYSRAYGIALAKYGVFEDQDSIGIALTRPIHVYQGGVDISAATSVDADGNLIMSSEHVSLSSTTPETDLEAGYVTSYLDGALSLQANAAYQMNVNGRSGTNAVTLLSRVKFSF